MAEVEDELFRLARVVEGNDELRSTLTDPHLPAARRQQIVEDLLGGKATTTTVASSRWSSAPVGQPTCRRSSRTWCSAPPPRRARSSPRSARPSRSPTTRRPASPQALKATHPGRRHGQNVIDPSVLGGVVTQIGDTVIDGSVRPRLNQLRDAF